MSRHRHAEPARRPSIRVGVVGVAVAAVLAIGLGVVLWMTVFRPPSDIAESGVQSGDGQGSPVSMVDVSGRPGSTPTVAVHGALHAAGVKSRVVTAGDGREVTEGSPVLLAVTAFDAQGALRSETGYPTVVAVHATAEDLGSALVQGVVGKSEGTRMVFLRPAEDSAPGPEIDVVDILPTVADGEPPAVASEGPLQVEMGDGGPVIRHGDEAPASLVTQVVLEGKGAQVADGDRVVAQYTLVGWDGGLVQANTWDTGVPQVIDLSTAMPGVRRALVDRTVGSRVAVTIPADQALGDGVMCAVVDILAIDHQAEGAQSE